MSNIVPVQAPNLISVIDSIPGISKNTRDTYRFAMISYNKFLKETDKDMNLNSLVEWLEGIDTPATQLLYSSAARKIFSEIYKGHPQLQELKDNISNIKKTKIDHTITESKFLTKEEVKELIDILPVRIGLMVEVMFMTGLRISPLLSMRYDKCTPIRDGKVIEVKVISKGSKESSKYITAEIFERIKETFQGKTYLFETSGGRYSRIYVTNVIARYGRKMGKNISAHTIRHSFSNNHMENGMPIDKLSAALDHASITTTADFYLSRKPSLEELGVI